MGKTPKPKNKGASSLHSRAARRATSPSLEGNVDKSLAKVPRADSNHGRNILAPHSSAGVTKKSKKSQVSRHQRLRREKGMQKADEFAEKLQKKAVKSGERTKKIKERAKAWEDVNESSELPVDKSSGFDTLRERTQKEDSGMEIEDEENCAPAAKTAGQNNVMAPEPIPAAQVPLPEVADDEIL